MRGKTIGIVLLCAGLGACASGGGERPKFSSGVIDSDVDVEKVTSVNTWGHSHGAQVIWIHYPTKPKIHGNG